MTICFHYDMVLGTGHFYEKHVGLDMFNPVKYVNTVLNLGSERTKRILSDRDTPGMTTDWQSRNEGTLVWRAGRKDSLVLQGSGSGTQAFDV